MCVCVCVCVDVCVCVRPRALVFWFLPTLPCWRSRLSCWTGAEGGGSREDPEPGTRFQLEGAGPGDTTMAAALTFCSTSLGKRFNRNENSRIRIVSETSSREDPVLVPRVEDRPLHHSAFVYILHLRPASSPLGLRLYFTFETGLFTTRPSSIFYI